MEAMRELPGGEITCLFSDIEGSTRLLRDMGAGYRDLLVRHNELLREVWAEHQGHEISTIGDAFFVVFANSASAVRAAVGAQRALEQAAWPARVRIGLHTGHARPVGGDYTALVVNQAARVVDAARGGQVLMTAATADGADAGTVRSLGLYRVRDFDGPVRLYAAVAGGLPEVDATPRVPPAEDHNFARPPNSLVGRGEDLSRLVGRVRPGQATTLLGPGGVGKTRLAVEVALASTDSWRHGTWFVDLSPVTDAALVAAAIGEAVAAPSEPDSERWAEVVSHLERRNALIVLDNCEHLGAALAKTAAELISACPEVGILATSRVPLGLRGEDVYRVAPLSIDGASDLFADRSAVVAERTVVADLCRELDCLPLAIELAAGRATALPPAEILRQVRRSHAVVRSRDPTLPDRQRSLERVLDWSVGLLDADARTVLDRLTAFAGSFSLEAAEAVCAGGEVEAERVPELVWDLIDASLVRALESAGATRFALLATVRAHARERADPDDLAGAVGRLATFLLERIGPFRATRWTWLTDMEVELDNVREATAEVAEDSTAQSLAWCIGRYSTVRDHFHEGIAELERLLDARPEAGPERVALLTLLADLHLLLGDAGHSEAVVDEAQALASRCGTPAWDAAGVARTRGELALRRGEFEAAATEAREGLEREGSPQGRARLYDLLGVSSASLGDLEASAAAFSAELEEVTSAQLETHLATAHGNLAETYVRLGRDPEAAHHQRVALGLSRDWGQPVVMAFSLMIAARLAANRGDWRDTVVLQTKADELLDDADYALYDADLEIRREVLEKAKAQLGSRSTRRPSAPRRESTPVLSPTWRKRSWPR